MLKLAMTVGLQDVCRMESPKVVDGSQCNQNLMFDTGGRSSKDRLVHKIGQWSWTDWWDAIEKLSTAPEREFAEPPAAWPEGLKPLNDDEGRIKRKGCRQSPSFHQREIDEIEMEWYMCERSDKFQRLANGDGGMASRSLLLLENVHVC